MQTTNSKKILIVDDELHIREIIKFTLQKAGMLVSEANNGLEALKFLESSTPDLIVLDVTMPELDGLETCKVIRKSSEIPILFLSARDEEIDRVLGLEIGADDYVTKPFSPRELLARVNVILKRTLRITLAASSEAKPKVLEYGKLKIEPEAHKAYWEEQEINLTATEFNLLLTFMEQPLKVHTRNNLINHLYFSEFVSDRTIDSHIRRLRSKYFEIGAGSIIETVHGVGYKLVNTK